MQNTGENPNRVVRILGKQALAITLFGVGKLLANIIINTGTGAIAGHIDAGCAVDVSCSSMVIETVRNLPLLIPALIELGTVKNIVMAACSRNPAGGRNMSIKGQIE